ncbi:MAG: hypothetical protein ACREYE_13105 [Gammaproteobacteria bacterium]
MKKSAALGISRSGGARDPQVFHYTLRLLVSSLRLAPSGLAFRFGPAETVLRSGGTRPPVARGDFFTSSERVDSPWPICPRAPGGSASRPEGDSARPGARRD